MQEMQDISNQIFSNNALGLVVAGIIFLVTILLIIRRLIGTVVTVILLFFAVVSGLAVAHNDIVRDWLQNKTKDGNTAAPEDWETRFQSFKTQLLKDIDSLKSSEKSKETEKPAPATPEKATTPETAPKAGNSQ